MTILMLVSPLLIMLTDKALSNNSGFSTIGGYLIDWSQTRGMYESLMSIFPFVHSVLALTVSAP
jgi:hypothetical protein